MHFLLMNFDPIRIKVLEKNVFKFRTHTHTTEQRKRDRQEMTNLTLYTEYDTEEGKILERTYPV